MFSKKTQLCIDLLVTIGSAAQGASVTTQALAQKMSMSVSYIESIMRLLREAGFVRSARGPGGGYFLTRQPDQISIWAVVRAIGGLDEWDKPSPSQTGLTDSLEYSLHCEIRSFLSNKTLAEFVKTDRTWQIRPASIRFGFGLGPKPASLMPVAPNSVFELSSFLQSAAA
jgi:Rrf2 family protein